jgi:CheY-like chemotaxis protein
LELLVDKYEIASLISDTAQLNVMRIGSKPITFELHADGGMPAYMLGDELRVKQVLNNLLSNAFKYTKEGSVKMSVEAEIDENGNDEVILVVTVDDTGPGMTDEQIKRLFDEYSRFNHETNRSTEGTGLGMSITNNLVNLMNGKILVESRPGKGSVFTVRLPQLRVGNELLGKEMAENLQRFRTHSRAQMRRVQISREPMPYGNVLIVDDVESNIFVAKGLLVPYELKTDSADSGFAAIEKIKSGSVYDIIFMDHMMPQMDGIEATKILRGMGYDHPIVALTANAVAGQANIFLGNGFDDFISKPIDIRQLNIVLNKLIRDKQPPEVIEAARQQAAETKKKEPNQTDRQTDDLTAVQPAINPKFVEIFVRDARKSLAVLDGIMEKGGPRGDDELRTYTIHVHGIKGVLATIGKMALSAVAMKLEELGRQGDVEAIISETPAFVSSLRDFVEELASEQESAEEVTEDDTEFLREKLLAIKTACEEYDEVITENALKELKNKTWTPPVKELLDMISRNLLHCNFDEIVEAVSGYLNQKQ